MRTKTISLVLWFALWAFATPVSVKHLMVLAGAHLGISTASPPDAATVAALTDPANLEEWKVSVKRTAGSAPVSITVTGVRWFASSQTFDLDYDATPLAGDDPRHYGWTVSYSDPANGVKASQDPPASGIFQPAKSKSDANLYLAGSYLAGESTKPIYTIDAKLGWVPEIGTSGYFAGLEATVQVNSGSTPPADRTRVDPDALSADTTVHFMRGPMAFNLYPARGEFSRKNPESNFVPGGMIKWILDPIGKGRHAAVFYPSIGLEAGWNLNKPSKLFNQPVDLTGYNHIFRGVLGGNAAYYVRRPELNSSDPYVFEVSMTYIGRIPATNEPFVTSEYVQGQRQPLVMLNHKVRNHLEGVIQWNVTTFVGVQGKYTYGSLPPLFQFTDHQVTFGVTFKAKLGGHI
jgi:hypothetical protein